MKKHLLATAAIVAVIALPASFALAANATDTTSTAAGATAKTPLLDTTTNANTDTAANASTNGSVDATGSASATGNLTIKDIDVQKPFGDLTVDQTQTPDKVDAALAQNVRPELQNRCQLIIDNPASFDPSVATWCQSYITWKKNNM